MEKLPGIHELALVFAGVDCTKEPIPVMAYCPLPNGPVSPTNLSWEVIKGYGSDAETVYPRLFMLLVNVLQTLSMVLTALEQTLCLTLLFTAEQLVSLLQNLQKKIKLQNFQKMQVRKALNY